MLTSEETSGTEMNLQRIKHVEYKLGENVINVNVKITNEQENSDD